MMTLLTVSPDSYIQKYVQLETDPRTSSFLTFYCKVWILLVVYGVLSVLYLIWYPQFKSKHGSYEPMKAFIVIYNGFMFGCYGLGIAVSQAANGFQNFFICVYDKTEGDVRVTFLILMAVVLSTLKLIRFLEPLLYQVAGKSPPFSKLLLFEGFMVHVAGFIVIKYHCVNFFPFPTHIDGIAAIFYYAQQTLECGGLIHGSHQTLNTFNTYAQLIVRISAILHAVWGFDEPSCVLVRPLISLQYWFAIASLAIYLIDLSFIREDKTKEE